MTTPSIGNEIQVGSRTLIGPTEMVAIARRLGLSLRTFAYLMVMSLLSVGFEILAIGMLLPVLELMRGGGEGAIGKLHGAHWDVLYRLSALTGIPITLTLLLTVSFAFLLLRQFFRYYATRYKHTVERSMANTLRQQVFSRFLVADTTIQDHAQVGSLVPFIQVELRRALDVLMAATNAITLIFQIVSYFVALFLLSPVMSLICAGVMAVTGLLVQRPMAKIKGRGARITKLNREIGAFMVERLKHARLIRLSHTEKAETKAFHDLSVRLSEESLEQQMVGVRMQLVLEPVVVLIAFATFLIGGHFLGMSFERLGFFAIVLIRLVPTLRNMLTQYSHMAAQLPSLEALDRYMTQVREARESKGGPLAFERLDQGIAYDHVSYSYASSNMPALVDVTFAIPAHRMTALIGPSGSGKSTTIDLLPRLRVPSSGDILLDGVSIAEYSAASLRVGIAFVPQQPQIFNITAADHIRYGKEDATDEDVREAARLAGALDFIERLPQGFDTLLGDGGRRLSGGQRQRLDIARALVRRAPILVLDEPTSALDAEAEGAFRDVLRSLRTGTNLTIIVIAHRLSTISDADKILVFQEGRLTASGTHEELIASGGWYADACKVQQGGRFSEVAEFERTPA